MSSKIENIAICLCIVGLYYLVKASITSYFPYLLISVGFALSSAILLYKNNKIFREKPTDE